MYYIVSQYPQFYTPLNSVFIKKYSFEVKDFGERDKKSLNYFYPNILIHNNHITEISN